MTIAFSYIRFSSKKQELGDSLLRQTRLAREYADKHGLTLDNRSYTDLGVSAFKGKNKVEGALGALLQCIDEGKIPKGSYLLVESLDRVSREEVLSALDTFLSIIKRDIVLVTLLDGAVFTRENINENWTKLIAALAVIARANEESATKAKRVKEAWDAKRAAGEILTAIGPAWLKLSDDRKKWLLIPEKVKTVERAFELAVTGMGTPTIADTLNQEGHLPLGKAKFWEPALVMHLLRNSAVIGTYTPKKADADPIPKYYPEIIKPKLFATVKALIDGRNKSGGGRKGETVANLFAGLLRCECGARMRYVSASKPYTYLRCVMAYSKQGCDAPTMPYEDVEESILSLMQDKLEAEKQVLEDPATILRAELDDKRKALGNLIQVAELGKAYAGGIKTLAGKIVAIEGEIASLEQQIKHAVQPPDIEATRDYVYETYRKHRQLKKSRGNDAELRQLRESLQSRLKLLLTKVVLLKDTFNGIDDLIATSTDPDELADLIEERKTASGHDYRWLVLYGPFAKRFRGHKGLYTEDGGLKLDYLLKAWGINGTRRRKTAN